MEINTSTKKFRNLNFNLKKIIFSYLKPRDQRTIYWINKKLRQLLPDSPLRINIDSLRRLSSFQLDGCICGIFELSDGTITCWTMEGIQLLKLDGDNLKLTNSLNFQAERFTPAIQQENKNIIFRSNQGLR
jgi:hypothetical protein